MRGYTHLIEYKGASQDNMQALQQSYVAAGIACTLKFQFDVATLDVEDTTQQYTIDTWQIVGEEEHIDIFSHPNALGLMGEAQIDAVRSHLASEDTTAVAFADPILAPLAGGVIQRYYSLYKRGTTEYQRGSYVLKHTTNAPNRYAANVSDIGVGQIYTPGKLLTEASSGTWAFPIPQRLKFKIGAIPSLGSQANYLWGWLKKASTETNAANNRVDITTDYILELWSTDLYNVF